MLDGRRQRQDTFGHFTKDSIHLQTPLAHVPHGVDMDLGAEILKLRKVLKKCFGGQLRPVDTQFPHPVYGARTWLLAQVICGGSSVFTRGIPKMEVLKV